MSQMPKKEIRVERLRALAGVCHNLGVGILLVGAVGPMFNQSGASDQEISLLAIAVACTGAGISIVVGQTLLREALRGDRT